MLEEILRQLFVNAFTKLYGQEPPVQQINFQQTRPEFEGDLTVVVFPFVKMAKKAPEVMADEIGKEIVAASEIVSKYNVVKGFLNLLISVFFRTFRFYDSEQKTKASNYQISTN